MRANHQESCNAEVCNAGESPGNSKKGGAPENKKSRSTTIRLSPGDSRDRLLLKTSENAKTKGPQMTRVPDMPALLPGSEKLTNIKAGLSEQFYISNHP